MQDNALLTQYTQNHSEAAFAQLLARHLPLVYRTCRRALGSEALAEDAAQIVFLLLARKAKSLRAGPSLAGWLYQTAVFVAKDIRKQEAQRTRQEEAVMQEAIHAQTMPSNEWETVEPFLNSALSALKPADRDAVLLRFLEGHTLAETGALLGISEDAARMRCARALDKMRIFLTARGAAITTVTLATLLTTEAARSVSAQAVSILTTRTLHALATGPSPNVLLLSKGVLHTMKLTNISYATLAAVFLLCVVVIPLIDALQIKRAWALLDKRQTVRSLLDPAQSYTLTMLTNFNGKNGLSPQGSLVLSGNILYGTTVGGGANGDGTVFSVPTTGGTPTVLASFNGANGSGPQGLIMSGSTLYGTTKEGGADNKGTVFSVPIAGGTPTVLATFNSTNGSRPNGSLTLSGSTLYGTTENGGDNNKGTVFSLPTTGGTPTVLTSFSTEIGYFPEAGLTLNGSILYGTTSIGGPHNDGTVFSVPTTGGTPTILANFNGANGKSPVGNLTLSGNTLYGTTNLGGGVHYAGTVFSVPTTGGTPIVLATFNAVNGFGPNGKLTLIGSTLYGTTQYGGSYRAGTVFAVPTTGGTLTDIFSFNRTNGAFPIGGLTLSGSTLYGTTAAGGAADYSAAGFEHGIVFSISATGNTPIATK